MQQDDTVLILGGGQAAAQCAASLRRFGWEGRIIIAGEEPHPPYQRPPLSKDYLSGAIEEDRLWLQPPETWQAQSVELRLGVKAEAIDRGAKTVRFNDGSVEAYTHLVIATGARVRPLPVPGAELDGVRYLRTIADVDRLKADVVPGKQIAIIGAGYIGLEAAAVATKLGAKAVVIEAMPRCLARVAVPELSQFYREAHGRRGVEFFCDAQVVSLKGDDGHITGVELASGENVACDSALVGIGVIPNAEIAAEAELETGNGIHVDTACQTRDASIYAIGDVAAQPYWLSGDRLRIESVPNAIEQGKQAAAAICGAPAPKPEVPWFWSDQFDLKLQTAGLFQGADTLVERVTGEEQRSFFHLKDGALIAADCINDPQSFMAAKMMIAKGLAPDAAALADTGQAMKDVMKQAMAAG
ncbi:FAD-dependent oxidoreductase [Maricaulis sp.]|uniref:NAD(P)/FAD-dependent oxidoreductase n=1 Tax=Maricaulis sp. TaxID=1486257 RepID=UPI002629DACA|nr:FAD-dependent oxidoreductase [Maricaulis sp.]